jgi:hypothetical protein
MPVTLPTIGTGQIQIDTLNSVHSIIQANINSFDGAGVQSATIANAALAKPKNMFQVSLCFGGDFVAAFASTDIAWSFVLPNLDGASNSTFKYLGYSFYCFSHTAAAASSLAIQKNASTKQTIDLSVAQYTRAAGGPYVSMLGTAEDTKSGDRWDIVVTDGGGALAVGSPTLVLYFSVEHVGT